MFNKLFSRLKEFFNPFIGDRSKRPFILIGVVRFFLSLVLGMMIIVCLAFPALFIYHTFFCGENHHIKRNLSLIPELTINGTLYSGVLPDKSLLILPEPHTADSNNVVVHSSSAIRYSVNIYPSVNSPLIYIWILNYIRGLAFTGCLFLLHTILTNIINRNFFIRRNFFFLRIIGFLAFLSSIIEYFVHKLLVSGFYNLSNFDDNFIWFNWKIGVAILVVAEIFIAGIKIKEENDLTV